MKDAAREPALPYVRRGLDSENKPPATHSRPDPKMKIHALVEKLREYFLVFFICAVATGFNLMLLDLIGHAAIAIIYLLSVVLMALFVSRIPLLLGATLTTAAWGFLAPPKYSFFIAGPYDRMMVLTFFIVALIISHLMSRLRAHKEAEIKLLSESERLGRALLNSVSHELRTPIAVITSASSELRGSPTLNVMEQKLATEIESAGTRLNRIVQSLLSAARLQSGQIHPKIDWCDISDLVSVSLAEVAVWTEGRIVEEKIAPGLPLVKMDFVLMKQALTNLLINAAMYTPPGTPLEITARIENQRLLLEVADRGPGLPPEQIEHIFDLFYRLPDAKPGGTGLGLAIVRGFIETQNGQVKADNRPDGGAVFTISMPLSARPELPEESA